MNSSISLGRFREEIASFNSFVLTYDNAFSPISFSLTTDHVTVCLSNSPYVSFRDGSVWICLSHIDTIKKSSGGHDEKVFIFICNSYISANTPVEEKFSLRCKKLHK